jgi:hypothetical protein
MNGLTKENGAEAAPAMSDLAHVERPIRKRVVIAVVAPADGAVMQVGIHAYCSSRCGPSSQILCHDALPLPLRQWTSA